MSSCDLADTRQVVDIVSADATRWRAPEIVEDFGHYTWLVSAVDRGSNESAATIAR